jgi:hypothetical protein
VVDGAREHSRQLGVAHAPVERRKLRGRLRDGRLVVLGGAELEQNAGVIDVADQLLGAADQLLERRALAVDRLRLLLVVPEPRRERLPLEALDLRLQLGKVKDAPLAPEDAFGGRQACRAFR